MPSDSISNPCYYSDGICLLSCPEGTEVSVRFLDSVCVKIIIPDKEKSIIGLPWWFYPAISCGVLLVIVIIVIILLVVRNKKKKEKEGSMKVCILIHYFISCFLLLEHRNGGSGR
jgi:uncharacterized membrane protein YhdT